MQGVLTAKPSRRNSGFQASVASGSTVGEPARRAARRCRPARWTCRRPGRPARQVRQQRRRRRRRRSAGRRAYSPCFCGVPTQTKCTCAPRGVGEVGGEPQPAARQRLARAARAGPARRTAPCRRRARSTLASVDVDADDLVAELGHARGVDGAEVPAADDTDLHGATVATAPGGRGLRDEPSRPLSLLVVRRGIRMWEGRSMTVDITHNAAEQQYEIAVDGRARRLHRGA